MSQINFNIKPSSFYIYSRVSSQKQYNDANGLDYQDMVCENYLKDIFNVNINNVNYYCDIGSGYYGMNKLKDFNLMIKNIEANSLIVISEISRIGRNVHMVFALLKKLIQKNCWIISVSEGICFNKTKLMDKQFYQKVIDAEKESDLISIRTTNANRLIRSKSGHIGGVPFGKQRVKVNGVPVLVNNDVEIAQINNIKKLYNSGFSVEQIVLELDKKNIKKRNIPWTFNSVKNILKIQSKQELHNINYQVKDMKI